MVSKWFSIWWYRYLFEERKGYTDIPWIETIWCRMRNHPAGVIWFNPNGSEPDMHCSNCGDDLG